MHVDVNHAATATRPDHINRRGLAIILHILVFDINIGMMLMLMVLVVMELRSVVVGTRRHAHARVQSRAVSVKVLAEPGDAGAGEDAEDFALVVVEL